MNKEERKAYQKEYYLKHKDEIKQRYDAYYQEHKQEISKYNKQYRDKHKDKIRATSKKYWSTRKDKKKAYDRSRRLRIGFDMSIDEYNILLQKQNGVCAICKSYPKSKPLHVDHNHKTGKIRRLLCFSCNSIIGLAKEDINILTRMIEYLREFQD